MSRRMLDSSILSNMNFGMLPARAQVLQMSMIIIADDQGRLNAHPLYLAKEVFRYTHVEPADVSKWLEQMQENGTILLYTVEGKPYAQLVNWWEYQSLQFAHPSKFPRPEGWLDRLRFNSKGNQMMVANWTTPRGERLQDTCDQEGKPFPFVMELPVKQQPENPVAEVPAQVPAEVRTLAGTQAPTLVPAEVATSVATQSATEVRTQVTSQLTNFSTTNLTKEETTNNNNNNNMLDALIQAEAEKAVVVVGIDALLEKFDENQKMALLSWLWLYNGWYLEDLSYRDIFRRGYESDPFLGMKQPAAVMVKNAKLGSPAPLQPDDRVEMVAKLREMQEAQL